MITANYTSDCSPSCEGLSPTPAPALGKWVLCQEHSQWWRAIQENPEGVPSFLWMPVDLPPYGVLVSAGVLQPPTPPGE